MKSIAKWPSHVSARNYSSGEIMKRKTSRERLQAIIREYRRRNPGPFTAEAVVKWAMSLSLIPAPGRLTREVDEAAAWDARFTEIELEEIEKETA